MLRKNTAGQFIYFAGIVASTGAALTGATFSCRRCIDGTFAASTGTITEDTGLGFYKMALSQADTNGNDLGFFFTASTAVPVAINVITTAADPTDGVRLGLTALPNAVAGANGGLPLGDASGRVDIGKALGTAVTLDANNVLNVSTKYVGGTLQTARDLGLGRIQKNAALAKFEFLMTDSTNHNPLTGATVTVTRSIDGAAFASGTLSAVTEVSNGMYYVDFGAGDLNGNVITLRCTATGADDAFITLITSP